MYNMSRCIVKTIYVKKNQMSFFTVQKKREKRRGKTLLELGERQFGLGSYLLCLLFMLALAKALHAVSTYVLLTAVHVARMGAVYPKKVLECISVFKILFYFIGTINGPF